MSLGKKYTTPVLPALHSWGPDFKSVCVAHSKGDLEILELSGDKLKVKHSLRSHKHRVTGIDWHQGKNRIVTCGEDRNAYVWSFENGEWKPALVVLRVNRAALCCKWSPDGEQFAVGTSAKTIQLCQYDKSNNFWISQSISAKKSKVKSAVLTLSWHPNNLLIAAGGSDFKCRVLNADVKSKQFGEAMFEFPSIGFVNCVAWSLNKTQLAFSSQSAQLTVVSFDGANDDYSKFESHEVHTKQLKGLPLTSMFFDVKGNLIGAGHDHKPYKFAIKDNKIQDPTEFEVKKAEVKSTNMFKQMRNKKKSNTVAGHNFAVMDVKGFSDTGFSTVAPGDNCLVKWNL